MHLTVYRFFTSNVGYNKETDIFWNIHYINADYLQEIISIKIPVSTLGNNNNNTK